MSTDKIRLEVSNFTAEKGRKTETVAYLKIVSGHIPGTKRGRDGKNGVTPGQILAILLADDETKKHMIATANQAIAAADQANGNSKSAAVATPNVPIPGAEPLDHSIVVGGAWKPVTRSEAEKVAQTTPTAPMIRQTADGKWGNADGVPGAHSPASAFFVKTVQGEVVADSLGSKVNGARKQLT